MLGWQWRVRHFVDPKLGRHDQVDSHGHQPRVGKPEVSRMPKVRRVDTANIKWRIANDHKDLLEACPWLNGAK